MSLASWLDIEAIYSNVHLTRRNFFDLSCLKECLLFNNTLQCVTLFAFPWECLRHKIWICKIVSFIRILSTFEQHPLQPRRRFSSLHKSLYLFSCVPVPAYTLLSGRIFKNREITAKYGHNSNWSVYVRRWIGVEKGISSCAQNFY